MEEPKAADYGKASRSVIAFKLGNAEKRKPYARSKRGNGPKKSFVKESKGLLGGTPKEAEIQRNAFGR